MTISQHDYKSKLLIVDDKELNRKIMRDILSAEYNIFTARNGKGAVTIAKEEIPDLVLLDINMPEMDGYETCAFFKNDEKLKNIPIIFVTSMDEDEDEEKGLSLGAIDYIHKPVRPSILRARIRNHLELKKHRDILKKNSSIDSLTDLSNRREFDEHFKKTFNDCIKNKVSIGLVLIDVDCFKKFNDSYGHIKGDECLKKIADELKNQTKKLENIFIARIGGEEFAVIQTHCNIPKAKKLAEEIRKSIQNLKIPHKACASEKFVTISTGVSVATPENSLSQKNLFENADSALYAAKNNGRNRVEVK